MKIMLSAFLLSFLIVNISYAEVDAAKWNSMIELMPQTKYSFTEKWNNWDVSYTDFLGKVPRRRLENISIWKTTAFLSVEHNAKDLNSACDESSTFNASLNLTIPSLPSNLNSFENAPKVEGPLIRMKSLYGNSTYNYNRDALHLLIDQRINNTHDGKIRIDLSGDKYKSIACAVLSGELDAEIYYKISYEVGTPIMTSDVWMIEENINYFSRELDKELLRKPLLKNDQAAKLILTGILLKQEANGYYVPKILEKWSRPLNLLKALSQKNIYVLREYRIPHEHEVDVTKNVTVSSTESINVSIRKISND